MQGILGKLGNNFFVAAFIPALGFVVIAQLVFSPIIPSDIKDNFLIQIGTNLDDISLLPVILTLLLGYTLLGLNTFIYKAIEGYYLPRRFSVFQKRQAKKALKRKLEYKIVDKALKRLKKQFWLIDDALSDIDDKLEEKKSLDELEQRLLSRLGPKRKRLRRKIDSLNQLNYELKAQYRQDYPLSTSTVLPTRFGNILRAAEIYSNEHYGMDAVTLWPRLIHAIDDRYHQKLDESNNGLAFITNSMVLAVFLAFLCLIAAGYQGFIWQYAEKEAETQLAANVACIEANGEEGCEKLEYEVISYLELVVIDTNPSELIDYKNRAFLYLILVPIQIAVGYFFYNATLPAARQYGNLIRSAYDLFRFDLLNQLRLELPEDSDIEYDHWKTWSEFVALGSLEKQPRAPFVYRHPSDSA